MSQPHKHAALIKAWADGATIEARFRNSLSHPFGPWQRQASPTWDTTGYAEYRKNHKWQKEMDAQAAGKIVQYRAYPGTVWKDGRNWRFHDNTPEAEYRIKPEPITLDACVQWLNSPTTHLVGLYCGENYKALNNVRFSFLDGALIGAEVLK